MSDEAEQPQQIEVATENVEKTYLPHQFKPGNPGGPGRPKCSTSRLKDIILGMDEDEAKNFHELILRKAQNSFRDRKLLIEYNLAKPTENPAPPLATPVTAPTQINIVQQTNVVQGGLTMDASDLAKVERDQLLEVVKQRTE